MYRKPFITQQGFVDLLKRHKDWSESDIRRFEGLCYDKAPTCACGCGEKTNVLSNKVKKFSKYMNSGIVDVKYSEILPYHNFPFELTSCEFQAVISSLLGDGYMNYPNKLSKFPRLQWNMGNKEHAEYKRDFFHRFNATLVETENPGWGSEWFQVRTPCLPALVDIYKQFRLDDKVERARRIFPILDDVGWAWFYGDDGHYDSKRGLAFLHTEGLGEEGSKICLECLNHYLGMNAGKVDCYLGGTPKKERYMVRLNRDGSDEFIKRVKKHMAKGMEYKTGESH